MSKAVSPEDQARKLTPPQVARRFGVSPDKVRGFIANGELKAINVAAKMGGRPRYRIDVADLAAFEKARNVNAAPPRAVRRVRRRVQNVVEYF